MKYVHSSDIDYVVLQNVMLNKIDSLYNCECQSSYCLALYWNNILSICTNIMISLLENVFVVVEKQCLMQKYILQIL